MGVPAPVPFFFFLCPFPTLGPRQHSPVLPSPKVRINEVSMACDSYTRPALRLALARVLSHLVRHAAEVHLNWRASSKSRTPLRKRTTAGKRAAHGLSHDSALQGHLPPRQGCWVQFLRASKTSLGSHGDWERVVGDSFARDGCTWMRY